MMIIAAVFFCSAFVKATHNVDSITDLDDWDPDWGVIDLPWEASPAAFDTTTTTTDITPESFIRTDPTNPSVLIPRFQPSSDPAVLPALEILSANPDINLGAFVSGIRRVRMRTSVKQAGALYQSLLAGTSVPQWFHAILLSDQPMTADLQSQIITRFAHEQERGRPTDVARLVDLWRIYCIIPMTTDPTACEERDDAKDKPVVQLSRAQRQRLFADMLLAETVSTVSTTTTSPPLNTSEDRVWELHEIAHYFSPRQLRDILAPRTERPNERRVSDHPLSPTEDTVEVSPAVGSWPRMRAVKHPLETPVGASPDKRVKGHMPDDSFPMTPMATMTMTTTTPVPSAAVAKIGRTTLSFMARLAGLGLIRTNPSIDADRFWNVMRAQFPTEPPGAVAELLNSVYTRTRFALWFDARLRQEGYKLDNETVASVAAAVAVEANLTHIVPALLSIARDWIRFCKWTPCAPASEAGMNSAQARPESVRIVAREIMAALKRTNGKSMRSDDLAALNRWTAFRAMSLMSVHSPSP